MQTLIQTFPIESSRSIDPVILLDIETTGLSPDMSAIFMIGCACCEDNKLSMIQWLADSLELAGEQDVLNAFAEWLGTHMSHTDNLHLITYNGHTFDLPFLKIRYAQCGLKYPIDASDKQSHLNTSGQQTLDLYREFLPLKALWPTTNMKLKSMSEWLGYRYSDAPEGRRLIKAYHEYIKTKDSEILNLLFLHNADDLRALYTLLPLYNYLLFFNGAYTIVSADIINESILQFCLKPKDFLPMPLTYEAFDSRITFTPSGAFLQTEIHPRGLRYYYADIKNYVYLPDEDYVLHKSMTAYIDKSHWQKARIENCYTWFSPDEAFLNEPERQREYVQMIFRLFGFLR